MHVKMEVDFTVEQDYNLQILKEAKFSELTLWDSYRIRLGLEFRLIQNSDIFPPMSAAMTANGGGKTAESMRTH